MKIANRYRLDGPAAAGGMGEIAECTDSHLNRRVVLKRLQAGVEQRRLLDEQKALAHLRSKHVVQLFDIVELGSELRPETGLILEYIDGVDLEPGSFEVDDRYLHVLWQLSCGLADIHAAGVIHRDIKPNNVRIDRENVLKIIDFGLSRPFEAASTQSIIGTPIFMAPELWGEQVISFDYSIDTYAFGVTCLLLLNREFPQEITLGPQSDIPLAVVEKLLLGLREEVVSVLHGCMARAPEDRPRMADIRDLLQKQLLQDKHRALVVMNGIPHQLDKHHRKISLKAENVASIAIEYDGFDFRVVSCSGLVTLNNTAAIVGSAVPACCVITFGSSGNRQFLTFDVSNPEVMP